MNVDRIAEDYKIVSGEWKKKSCSNKDTVAAYFGDYDSSDVFYEIADTHGEIALDEYTDFVSSIYFPENGSWLGIMTDVSDKNNIEEANELRRLFNEELINHRFYSHMSDMVRNGAMYRNSVLNITNIGELNLNIVDGNNISLSPEKGEGRKRVYIEDHLTIAELIEDFSGEVIDRYRSDYLGDGSPDQMKQAELMTYKTVITGVIPTESVIFGTGKHDKYKYIKIYLVLDNGEYFQITNEKEGTKGFYSFPLLNYSHRGRRSLAEKALTYALNANRYEMQRSERGEIENYPTMVLDKQTLMENQYSLGARGIVGIGKGETPPSILQTTGQSSITRDDIQDAHAQIDRVFKADLIRRTQITSVSNFQGAELMLAAIKATAFSCYDLINVSNDAIRRIADILIDTSKNKRFRELLRKYRDQIFSVGIQNRIEKLEKVAKIGRFMQSFAPYAQAKPSSTQILSGDGAGISLAAAMDLPDVLASQDEINAERQKAAEQQRQNQLQQQQESAAKVAVDEAKAQGE